MGYIFPILAWLQIAWGWVGRMLGKFLDSMGDAAPGYYGLAGEWVTVDPPADPHEDPQAAYSASNAAAQTDVWASYAKALREARDNAKCSG